MPSTTVAVFVFAVHRVQPQPFSVYHYLPVQRPSSPSLPSRCRRLFSSPDRGHCLRRQCAASDEVILKMKSRHVTGTITTKKKSV